MKMLDRSIHLVLVWLSAWAAACVCLNAFYAADAVAFGPLVAAAVTGVAAIALTWICDDRSRWVPGGIAAAVAVMVCLAACTALSTSENPLSDEAGSWLYVVAPMLACGVACPLLTRSLAGSGVWLVASGFACGAAEALYRGGDVVYVALCVLAGIALCVHANVRGAGRGAAIAESTAGARAGTVLGAPLACVAAALVLWFAVIAPLGPPSIHITLFEEYKRLPYEFVEGVAQIDPTFDFSLTGDQLVEGLTYTTDDLVEGDDGKEIDAKSLAEQTQAPEDDAKTGGGNSGGSHETIDQESMEEQFDPISYSVEYPWWLLLLLIPLALIAAIVAFFVLRRRRRSQWLAHVLDDLPPGEQVKEMYLFLTSRLARIGFKVPPGMTLAEFSRNNARRMDGLRDETKVPFSECTAVYERCAYGNVEPTDEECVVLVAWCSSFWRAARAHLGSVRYFFKSFRLNPPRAGKGSGSHGE